MKQKKTKNKKYPLRVTLDDGTRLTIPKQAEFDNAFLRKHGCSIMAEYIALQYLGIKKWPLHILQWHRKHTPKDIKAKVTLKGVSKGINRQCKGKGMAYYFDTVTAGRISNALRKGQVVIMEQKDPIHSIVLLPDKKGCYMASYGKVKKVSINGIAKTATKNKTYRGMITVRRMSR